MGWKDLPESVRNRIYKTYTVAKKYQNKKLHTEEERTWLHTTFKGYLAGLQDVGLIDQGYADSMLKKLNSFMSGADKFYSRTQQ